MSNFFEIEKSPLLDEEIASSTPLKQAKSVNLGGLEVKSVTLTKKDGESLGISAGRYVTLNAFKGERRLVSVGGEKLRELISKNKRTNGKILVVGIGNPYMTTDSLGPAVIENLMRNRKENILLFTPYLEGITGISSFDIIRALIKCVSPSLVIAVDALSARKAERICKSYQFTDSGLTPGSALGKIQPLSRNTLGIPVIGIGAPTVVNCRNLNGESYSPELPNMLVCPKNINELVSRSAKYLSDIIRLASE